MTQPFPPGVEVTYLSLGRQLDDAVEAGLRVPCREDPEPWFAECAAERRAAAARCDGCPVIAACRRYATAANESFGVWAGVDRETAIRETRYGARQVELDLFATEVAS